MKRKTPSFRISEDADAKVVAEADINLTSVFPKNKSINKEKKDLINLGDISHKNVSGENNWQTFLKLNKQKGLDKPKLKNITSPSDVHELPLANLSLVPLPKEKSRKRKSKNPSKSNSRPNDKPDPGLSHNEDKSLPEEKPKSTKPKPVLTKYVAMDCEMVGVEVGVNKSILAKVSLVNSHGDCIYDKFVKPTEPILDYRTHVSGIRPKDLESATDFNTVQKEVADILKGRILVGHSLHNDLRVLFLSHPRFARRDTSTFAKFRGLGPIPSLKTLVKKYLGATIQDGEHSSVQDALAAMQLYKMFKKEWEDSFHQKKFPIKTKKTKTVTSSQTTNMDV